MIGLLRSEWVKIRSVQSTWIVVAFALGSIGLFSLVAWNAASLWDGLPPEGRQTMSVAPLPPLGAWVASLCLAVLGVLAITSEYANGSIRSTFAVEPRRWPVLLAKAGVVGMLALLVGLVVSFGTSFAVRTIIDGRPITGQMTALSTDVPLLLSSGLSIAMFALLGLGLGSVTRSATVSIATVVVLWHPLPMAVMAMPAPWNELLGSGLPIALAGELSGEGNQHLGSGLSPLGALAAMAAWAFAPLVIAVLLTNRRDAR